MVTGCHAPQDSDPSETKVTGRLKLAALSLLESCFFFSQCWYILSLDLWLMRKNYSLAFFFFFFDTGFF